MKNASAVKRKSLFMSKRISWMGYIFILPFFMIYLVFEAFPIVYSFCLSFYQWDGIGQKIFVGFDNYIKIFTKDPYFLKSIGNTMIIMVGYLPITLILGLLIAILMFNKNLKYKRFFQTTQFLPYIVVPVACGLLFMLMFDWGSGVVNKLLISLGILKEGINWLGSPGTGRLVLIIMQIWRLLGYVVTIYLAGLTNISPELIEAAEIDGAKQSQVVVRIITPLLKNVTLFLLVTNIIDGLQLFDAPKILFTIGQVDASIGGPQRSCLTPVWYLYDIAFGGHTTANMGLGAAVSYGLFIFIVIFSVLNYKITNGKGDNE